MTAAALALGPARRLGGVLRLLRPLDWSKNSFVFAGLLFGHRWNEPAKLQASLLAFAAFCAMASAVYVVNDLLDRHRDAHHPTKRHRPIAAGVVAPSWAVALAAGLAAGALWVGHWVSPAALGIIALYAVLNIAYTVRLKQIVLLDVFVIASGFVLRILTGTVGVDIPPSPWILICGLTLALFLGFCKRRAELEAAGEDPGKHRPVLDVYSPRDLEQMIGICAACAIITYSLYTIDDKTAAAHGTPWLMATVPFVIYGILRYIHRLHAGGGGGRPALDVVRDPHLITTIVGWLVVTAWLLA